MSLWLDTFFGRREKKQITSRSERLRNLLYWHRLRNRHAGRRGFIIGNGPSLKIPDLDRLQGEITLASNRIYLAFDQTAWRPTYHLMADPVLWEKIHAEVCSRIPLLLVSVRLPTHGHTNLRRWNHLKSIRFPYRGEPDFSADLRRGVRSGGETVTFTALQLAVHLGLDPIYLIGCDHSYRQPAGAEKGKPVTVADEVNHFLPNYRLPGETVNPAPLDLMTEAYRHAKGYGARHGIRILNATRGGELEVFPRADFDSLF